MFVALLIFLVLAIGLALLASRGTTPPLPPTSPSLDDLSPTELAEADPVEALLRYGTPEDAARLADQGVDLGGLGFRPPPDA